MRATAEEVIAMKQRLEERRNQKIYDMQIDEVIKMVSQRPVIEKPVTSQEQFRRRVEAREHVQRVIPAANAFTLSAVALICFRSLCDNWLFLLVFGMTVFCAVAVC